MRFAFVLCIIVGVFLSSSSRDAERVYFGTTRLGFVRVQRKEEKGRDDWFPAYFVLLNWTEG